MASTSGTRPITPDRVRKRLNFSPSPSPMSTSSRNSRLSRDEIDEILTSPYETGYTYSKSGSYVNTKSMDFEHPRLCRRIPTAPPDFEHDPIDYQRDEYESQYITASEPGYTFRLTEFGPLEPKKRHKWYWQNNFASFGCAGWPQWVISKLLYAVQVMFVFIAALLIYSARLAYSLFVGNAVWVIKHFVVRPIIAPYRATYRKTKMVYRTAGYVYPTLRELIAWIWSKITGQEVEQRTVTEADGGDFEDHVDPRVASQLGSRPRRQNGQQQVKYERPSGIFSTIYWLLSFGMLRQALSELAPWAKSAYSSLTQSSESPPGAPIGARTRSQYGRGGSHPAPSAPPDEDDNVGPPPAYSRHPTHNYNYNQRQNSVTWRVVFLPVLYAWSLVKSVAGQLDPMNPLHSNDYDPVGSRTRSHADAPSIKASARKLVGILKTSKQMRSETSWSRSISNFFTGLDEVIDPPKKKTASINWWRMAKWVFIGLPLALLFVYLLAHAWLWTVARDGAKPMGSSDGHGVWNQHSCSYYASEPPEGRLQLVESVPTRASRKVACHGDRLFALAGKRVSSLPLVNYSIEAAKGMAEWLREDPRYRSGEALRASDLFSLDGPKQLASSITTRISGLFTWLARTLSAILHQLRHSFTSTIRAVRVFITDGLITMKEKSAAGLNWIGSRLKQGVYGLRSHGEWVWDPVEEWAIATKEAVLSVKNAPSSLLVTIKRFFNRLLDCVYALLELIINLYRAAFAWIYANLWSPMANWITVVTERKQIQAPTSYGGIETLSQLPANHPLLAQIRELVEASMAAERKSMEQKLAAAVEKRQGEETEAGRAKIMEGQKIAIEKEMDKRIADFTSYITSQLNEQNSKLSVELHQLRQSYDERVLKQQLEFTQQAHEKASINMLERNEELGESIYMEKVRHLIKEYIQRYDADKTGLADYALESSGGAVVSIRCTKQYTEKSRTQMLFGIPLWYSSYSPRSVIQRRTQGATAGECWAFEGGHGYLTLRLAQRINVTAVSYEHLPLRLSPDGHIQTAPKQFLVWSYQDVDDLESKSLIGNFTFNDRGEPLQMFAAQHHDPRLTPVLELETLSNYGAPVTCLYRFRVHGKLPKPRATPSDETMDEEAGQIGR